MGTFGLTSFNFGEDEERKRREEATAGVSPIQKQVFDMLMDNFARQSELQNKDPLTIADEALSGVSVGRRFLQSFFTGFARTLGNDKVKTIREQLVEREVLKNQMALQRLQRQESQLRTFAQFSGQVTDDQLAAAKAQFEQGRAGRQEAREDARLGIALNAEQRAQAEFEQKQAQAPAEAEKAQLELQTSRARLEELNDPFSKVTGNTRAFIEAFREEHKRNPSKDDIEAFLAKQKPVTQTQVQLLGQIPTDDPVAASAQSGYRAALGRLSATQQKSFAASLADMARTGADLGDFKQQMEAITRSTMPAGADGKGATGFLQRKENIMFLQVLEHDIDAFVRRGGKLGILEGTDEQIRERLGTLSKKNPELASFAQRMGTFFIAFRKQHSGVAFKESESAEYRARVPRITANVFLNKSIINDLRQAYLRNHRSDLDGAIGTRARKTFFGEMNPESFVVLPDGRVLVRAGDGTLVEF